MSRLTKKDISGNYDLTYENGDFVRGIMPNEKIIGEIYINGMNKLGKLEDIEDELGCPLYVVFKALKDKEIIVKHTIGFPSQVNNLKTHRISGLQFNGTNFIFWLYDILCSSEFSVELKDYKKTWWLKEDLSE